MLPDVSAVTAACEKRRKFALCKIKNNAGKGYAARRRINLYVLGMRRVCPPCKFDYFRLSRCLVKFALKFSSNLRPIKFDRALARFGRRGFVNLTASGFASPENSALNLRLANLGGFYFSPALCAGGD